ncbi:CaiB/BaiF CoA-transferase family protein [Amycolatopsis sp. GM8]|uniref:CaiB/BaiF CoA transferase family protein n=1 Tax=Amycolatopsis sp. GM8 TaxID=2896530 RepID=UPI001F2B80C0|nr:CoA transferase [Amycolatopsis sp. GM8]
MGPLDGVRVLDMGNLAAGPITATLLGDLGAEVIKIEHPRIPDAARGYGPQYRGKSLYWRSIARNKRCVTLDLSRPEGRPVLDALIERTDILVENFRPGTLEKWGITWPGIQAVNPRLILLRTSAFGQSGPYRQFPGFGTLAEAMSGYAFITGEADGPPQLPQFPLADGLAAYMGAVGVLAALRHRNETGRGQWIDNNLYEPIMRLIEIVNMEYRHLGTVRQRTGSRLGDSSPRGAYRTATKDTWVALSGSSNATALRALRAIGRDDWADDPAFATNPGRVERSDEIHQALADWIGAHEVEEVLATFRAADAPIGQIYDAATVAEDPHFRDRELFVRVPDDDGEMISVQNVMPRFSETPGSVRRLGVSHGHDTDEIYGDLLGFPADQLAALRESGVI